MYISCFHYTDACLQLNAIAYNILKDIWMCKCKCTSQSHGYIHMSKRLTYHITNFQKNCRNITILFKSLLWIFRKFSHTYPGRTKQALTHRNLWKYVIKVPQYLINKLNIKLLQFSAKSLKIHTKYASYRGK